MCGSVSVSEHQTGTIPGSGFFHLLYLEFALNHISIPSCFSCYTQLWTRSFSNIFPELLPTLWIPPGVPAVLLRSTDKSAVPSWLNIQRIPGSERGSYNVSRKIHSFIPSFPAAFPGLGPGAIWRHGSNQEHDVLALGQLLCHGKNSSKHKLITLAGKREFRERGWGKISRKFNGLCQVKYFVFVFLHSTWGYWSKAPILLTQTVHSKKMP